MANKKCEKTVLFNKALAVVKDKKKSITFIVDLVSELPCRKSTFYDLFPADSEEMKQIKEIIDENRIRIKRGLRTKWYNGDNATCQIALYKLIGTEEERNILNANKLELTGKDGKPIETVNSNIDMTLLEDETSKELIKQLIRRKNELKNKEA